MYIPKHYKGNDIEGTIAFMQRFNFATIISAVNNVPMATHLPFVIEKSKDKLILSSHFARANPHWENIVSNENLVIFTEPHAYISPKHYNKKENVPTWNYLAVHAYGKAQLVEDEEKVFELLERMMDSFEPKYKAQWQTLSMEYKLGMAKGIVAFEIEVSKIESKEKLSQNKKENERASIINSLSKSTDTNEKIIAEYMEGKELK